MYYQNPQQLFGGSRLSNLYSNNYDGVNEYLEIPDNAAFSFVSGSTDLSFSLSFWINRADANTGFKLLFAKNNGVVAEWVVAIQNNFLQFFLSKSDTTAFVGAAVALAGVPVSLINDGWHLVTCTFDASLVGVNRFRIYKDTTSLSVGNYAAGAYTSMSNTVAPVRVSSPAFPIAGKIAHEAIWNKGLSSAEVTDLFNKKMGDYRTLSFAANLVSAYYYPTGQSGYPTKVDYNAGRNGTMQNQESTDINTDVPT